MSARRAWDVITGNGPVVAVALHAGHQLRREVAALIAAEEDQRLREEDPATAAFGRAVPTLVTVDRSRFEVDLNRPRERAVYGDADDAWGITVWRSLPLPDGLMARSLDLYDRFYATMAELLDGVAGREGGFVLLDLHSYNHRRGGPDAAADDPAENPGVNVGTGSLDRSRWGGLVDGFMADLGTALGPDADVRENVKFRGGHLSRWVNERYDTGCCLAIEFKKTYMDEWSGLVDAVEVDRIADAVAGTLPGLERALRDVVSRRA